MLLCLLPLQWFYFYFHFVLSLPKTDWYCCAWIEFNAEKTNDKSKSDFYSVYWELEEVDLSETKETEELEEDEENILDELFGEEKDNGSISYGALEKVTKGIFLIDEIYEIPLHTQSKILRVLIDQKFISGIGNIYASEILFLNDAPSYFHGFAWLGTFGIIFGGYFLKFKEKIPLIRNRMKNSLSWPLYVQK
mgnify:CR=1 FL=1